MMYRHHCSLLTVVVVINQPLPLIPARCPVSNARVLDAPIAPAAKSSAADLLPRHFVLRVINDDIVRADADCLVVNHYAGAQVTGAANNVNELVNDAIRRAAARGELDSPAGRITFIPARRSPMIADVVAVLSMGEYEIFTKQKLNVPGTDEVIAKALQDFGRSMAIACCDAEQRDVATVAHGAGNSSQIPPAFVAQHLVTGYWQGLQESGKPGQSYTLTLVEIDETKCGQLVAGVELANTENLADALEMRRAGICADPANAHKPDAQEGYAWIGDLDPTPRNDMALPPHHLRVGAFQLDQKQLKLTVFSNEGGADQAVKDNFQASLVDEARNRLRAFNALVPSRLNQLEAIEAGDDPEAAAVAKKERQDLAFEVELRVRSIGVMLYNQVFNPNNTGGIRTHLDEQTAKNLLLRLDQETVSIPWELMSDEEDILCLSREMGRQMELPFLVRNHMVAHPNQDRVLRILLVSNPLGNLENVEREAQRIEDRLHRYSKVNVQVTHLSGDRATPMAVISRADQNGYDVFHFAGHATFDPTQPNRSGLVMAGGEILTVDAISRLTTPPRLIFFNACETAGTVYRTPEKQVVEMTTLGLLRPTAGGNGGTNGKPAPHSEETETDIVNPFFGLLPVGTVSDLLRSGITNFIGTTWPVEDAAAAEFAVAFYARLADSKTVGRGHARCPPRRDQKDGLRSSGLGQLCAVWGTVESGGVGIVDRLIC